MITDIKRGKYGLEGKVRFELFDTEIEVMIDEDTDIEYAQKCAEALNSLSEKTISDIWRASKNYCLEMFEMCEDFSDEMSVKITNDIPAEEIKACINPSILIVNEPEGEGIGFHLECGCEWEPEHGLEITILDDKLIYLGAFENCGAWDKHFEDYEMNFVNSI